MGYFKKKLFLSSNIPFERISRTVPHSRISFGSSFSLCPQGLLILWYHSFISGPLWSVQENSSDCDFQYPPQGSEMAFKHCFLAAPRHNSPPGHFSFHYHCPFQQPLCGEERLSHHHQTMACPQTTKFLGMRAALLHIWALLRGLGTELLPQNEQEGAVFNQCLRLKAPGPGVTPGIPPRGRPGDE